MANSGIHGVVELNKKGGIAAKYPTKDPNTYPKSLVNGGFESGSNGWIQGDLLSETLPPAQRADMAVETRHPIREAIAPTSPGR